jgi:hypothetical protein
MAPAGSLSASSLVALGFFALLVVGAALIVAVRLAVKQSTEEGPPSRPTDYVAPGAQFRRADETADEFRDRTAKGG